MRAAAGSTITDGLTQAAGSSVLGGTASVMTGGDDDDESSSDDSHMFDNLGNDSESDEVVMDEDLHTKLNR